MRSINLFCALVVVVASGHLLSGAESGRKSPTVEESREGKMTVLRVKSAEGAERAVYRLNLTKHHEPATARTDLIKRWESWRFGAFVCFNLNQFTGEELPKADDPKLYNPTQLDVAGWVSAFKAAGMRYAVLTARHTAPFLLWDSPTSEINVAANGNTNDVCRLFVEECRRQGLAPAFYYCLWGGEWNPTPNARAVILAQLYELATRYDEIPYFWLDMMNWAPTNLSTQEIYDALKNLQPSTMVEFNQHVQDGTQIKYWPTDVVDGEMVPPPAGGHNPVRTVNGRNYYLPFDYCFVSQSRPGGYDYDSLGKSCWFTYGDGKSFTPSRPFPAEAIAKKARQGWERGANNVLLAAAPDHTGRMRPEDVEQLRTLGGLLKDTLSSPPASSAFLKAKPEAIEAWQDLRFGMFVCWGPVSLTGLEIGWSRGKARSDQSQGGKGPTPVEVYDNLYRRWKPDKFDARAWVKVAQDAGAEYMIFLVKHHDGYCLYDTKLTNYKSTAPEAAWQHDVMKDIAEACHAAGLKLIPYYSQPDWHHPDYRTANHEQYIRYLHGQVRELLTGYGRLDGLWFDGLGGKAADWDAEDLFRMARELQPHLVINNRCGLPGDFDTPEQRLGRFQLDRPWETCMTLGTQWSWKPNDEIKSLKGCIDALVTCAVRGGNLALNTGPMPDGQIEPRQAERFAEIGRWLRKYGPSIYGTRGGPFRSTAWGGTTHRDNTIFVHVLNWPTNSVNLPTVSKRIVRSSVLTGGNATVRQGDSGVEIAVPPADRQELDTIIALTLDGQASELRSLATPCSQGKRVKASSLWGSGYEAEMAFDGNTNTRWGAGRDSREGWLEVDLGATTTVNRAVIDEGNWNRVRQFELQCQEDGAWKTIASGTTIGPDKEITFAPVKGQVCRLHILKADDVPTICEFELFEAK